MLPFVVTLSPFSNPWQPLVYSPSLYFCLFQISHKWNHTMCNFLRLPYSLSLMPLGFIQLVTWIDLTSYFAHSWLNLNHKVFYHFSRRLVYHFSTLDQKSLSFPNYMKACKLKRKKKRCSGPHMRKESIVIIYIVKVIINY